MIQKLEPGHLINFDYRRSDGRMEHRSGKFVCLEFGIAGETNLERWFIRLFCDKRNCERSFPLERIEMVYDIGNRVFWERTSNGYRRP